MTSYLDSGVNVAAGDSASKMAYAHAASTFASRKGMIGAPVQEEDGFAGFLDMGDYYLVQTDDGTGTKIDLAAQMGNFKTLGRDLLAMVADDAVCTGAEVISLSNTIDTATVDAAMIDEMMAGLAEACIEQKIVIPAGEIAEVPGAVSRAVWSATAVGVLEKRKVIRPETIQPGDSIISLKDAVARSNGFSLIRKILKDSFGEKWITTEWKSGQRWGDVFLTPSVVYHAAVLELIGRYGHARAVDVKGIAHITGGGIPSKLRRILKRARVGADLANLWQPHAALTDLMKLGDVATEEAYKTWNMGNGMMLVVSPADVDSALSLLQTTEIEAQIAGSVTSDTDITVHTYDGSVLKFS